MTTLFLGEVSYRNVVLSLIVKLIGHTAGSSREACQDAIKASQIVVTTCRKNGFNRVCKVVLDSTASFVSKGQPQESPMKYF